MTENDAKEVFVAYKHTMIGAAAIIVLLYLVYWFSYLNSMDFSFIHFGDPRTLAFLVTTICGFGILVIILISPALVKLVKIIAYELDQELNR